MIAKILSILFLYASVAQAESLESPEFEFKRAQDQLENLNARVRATRDLVGQVGLARQQKTIDQALDSAIAAQAQGDHVRVVRELQTYLSETQIPDQGKYLTAQKTLGDAYQSMGYQGKALRAYRRYLATFLTSNSERHGELLDVLKQMNALAVGNLKTNRKELSQLLSSVTSLTLSPEVRAEVLYWSARSAAIMQEPVLAKSWFARAREGTKDAVLKSRSLYFASLIAVAEKDLETADQSLSEALQLDIESKSQEADVVRLALARTASERGLFKRAQDFYLQIKPDSPQYRDALYDLVYVNVRLKQYKEGANYARTYLSKFRETRQGIEISNMLGYLSLHEEDFAKSDTQIASSLTMLQDLRLWVRKLLTSPTVLTQSQLRELATRTAGIAKGSPVVDDALALFHVISEQRQRNEDLRAEIRNNVITLGTARVFEINPLWMNTSKSLEATTREILEIGHRISSAERALFQNKLTSADAFRLENLERRRSELVSSKVQLKWSIDQYRSWINNQIMQSRIERSYDRLYSLRLRLVSCEYASSIHGNQSLSDGDFIKLRDIKQRMDTYSKSLGTVAMKLQERNLSDLAGQADHNSARKLLSRFSNMLHEESSILESYREDTQQSPERFLAMDALNAWGKWRITAKAAYEQFYRFDSEVRQGTSTMMSQISKLSDRNARVTTLLNIEQNRLERAMAQASNSLLTHYDSQISNNITRLRKWKGDLESLKFKKMQKSGTQLNAKLDLEREMARSSFEAALERGY